MFWLNFINILDTLICFIKLLPNKSINKLLWLKYEQNKLVSYNIKLGNFHKYSK